MSRRASGDRRVGSGAGGIPPFQVFLEGHRALVYRFLLATAGPQEADDCFQEAFLAALEAYPRLRDGSSLSGWILTIAARKAIDAARARRRRPQATPDVGAMAGAAVAGDAIGEGPDPNDPLWRAVRTLPPKQRAAVVLRFVLDRPYEEIAAVVGSSEQAARASASEGIRKLRRGWSDGSWNLAG